MPLPPRQGVVAPLAPQRDTVQFTASAETYTKLRLAQDLLRHQIPDGDLGTIVDRALAALVQDLARQTFAATARPRRGRGTAPGSRHLPAEVTRAVWLRDGGRCAFVGSHGRRCTEQGFLECHHVAPYGAGGESTRPSRRPRRRGWISAAIRSGPSPDPGLMEIEFSVRGMRPMPWNVVPGAREGPRLQLTIET